MAVSKSKFIFEIWGRAFRADMWANSPSNAKSQFIKMLKGDDSQNALRVRITDEHKQIIFLDVSDCYK